MKISIQLFKTRIVLGLFITGYMTLQFAFLIAREYNYIVDWIVALIPTYIAMFVAIVFFFYILIKSGADCITCDNCSALFLMISTLLFVLLLSVYLELPGQIDAFALFFPSATISIILFIVYGVRFGHKVETKRYEWCMEVVEKKSQDLD